MCMKALVFLDIIYPLLFGYCLSGQSLHCSATVRDQGTGSIGITISGHANVEVHGENVRADADGPHLADLLFLTTALDCIPQHC